MNLKILSTDIWMLLVGIYFIIMGIMLYKQKLIISYVSDGEKGFIICSVTSIISTTFVSKNKIDFTYFLIGIVVVISIITYIVFCRLNVIKYRVYNINREIYSVAIKNAIEENHINVLFSSNTINFEGTSSCIEFIYKGFIIRRYKQIPSYERLLLDIENNIKKVEADKNREWVISIICGMIFICLALVPFFFLAV